MNHDGIFPHNMPKFTENTLKLLLVAKTKQEDAPEGEDGFEYEVADAVKCRNRASEHDDYEDDTSDYEFKYQPLINLEVASKHLTSEQLECYKEWSEKRLCGEQKMLEAQIGRASCRERV